MPGAMMPTVLDIILHVNRVYRSIPLNFRFDSVLIPIVLEIFTLHRIWRKQTKINQQHLFIYSVFSRIKAHVPTDKNIYAFAFFSW